MKIAFITPCASRLAGGIFEIERRLAQSLAELPDTAVRVFSPRDAHTEDDQAAWRPLVPETFPYTGPAAFRYSSALRRAVLADDSDVAHLHALWMHTSLVTRAWHRRGGRPYVTTLNGMLEPWALRNSAWKKRLAAALFERDCLNRAACLQVNTEGELRSARAFGLRNPVCIIPNGIDLPEERGAGSGEQRIAPWTGRVEPGRKVLLYLGRLHPKKGLINFLKAWAAVASPHHSSFTPHTSQWTLAIAGWDQGGHEAELKKLCDELNVAWSDVRSGAASSLHHSSFIPHTSVFFLGPQHGAAKAACYANCDAFILPSFSEGLPMVVLEAWSHAKPVLMTPECNLTHAYAAGAALRIDPNPESIAHALSTVLPAPRSQLEAMGAAGRQLVAERYQWSAVARQLREVYVWLIGGGPAPATLVLS